MKTLKNNYGFSLVEVVIAAFLFSLLVGVCSTIFLSGSDAWQVNTLSVQLQQERRKAMDWIKEDLVEAGVSTITDVPADDAWHNGITFKIPAGVSNSTITWSTNTTNFALGGTGGYQVIRTVGGSTKVLAQNIHTLQFRRLSTAPNIVEISINSQKSTTRGILVSNTSSFKVKLRN